MKIKSIIASNFLSFEKIEINLSKNKNNKKNNKSNQNEKPQQEQNQNYFVLVGPNGSGKTNIFRLLEFVGNVFINRGVPTGDFKQYIRNGQDGFNISVSFELDNNDRLLLNTYLFFSLMTGVPEKIPSEDGRKKMYEFLRKNGYNLIDDDKPEITFIINASKFGIKDSKIIYNFNNHHLTLYQKIPGYDSSLTADTSGISRTVKDLCELTIEEVKQNNYEGLRSLADIIINNDKELNIKNHGIYIIIRSNIEYFIENIINDIDESCREKLEATYYEFVNALKFMGFDLKRDSISLGNFLAHLYNSYVFLLSSPRAPLKGSFKYMGIKQEENLRQTVRAIDGEELTKILFNFAHSENENEREVWLKLQDSMCKLLHMKPLFVLENDTAKIIFEEFEDCEKGQAIKQTSFDLAPAGAIELLTVLVSVAVANERVLLLDEPAANLHPPFQKKLYDHIKKIAETNNAQVIMITHSPYMINPLELESVWRMYLENGTSKVVNVGEAFTGKERWPIRQSKLLASLFADAVVLAEGDDEEVALEFWFEKSEKLKKSDKDIIVFTVAGDTNFEYFIKPLTELKINLFIFCDAKAISQVQKFQKGKDLINQSRVFTCGNYGDFSEYIYENYIVDKKQNTYRKYNPSEILQIIQQKPDYIPDDVNNLIDRIISKS